MLRKLLAGTVAALIIFSVSGCSVATKKSVEPASPEELVKSYYTCLINSQYDNAYDKYCSTVTKAIISKEDYVSRTETEIFTSGKTMTDVLIQDSELISEDTDSIYKVSGLIKYTENDKEDTESFYEYVVLQKNTGFYRLLRNGYLSYKTYTMPETDEKKFRSTQAVVYKTVEGKAIELTMINESDSSYSVGKGNKGPLLEVVSDEITYPYRYDAPVVINPGEKVTLLGRYDSLDGEITKITLSSIYSVGQDGKVIDGQSGKLYSVSLE